MTEIGTVDFYRFTSSEEREITRKLLHAIFAEPSRCITVDDGEDVTGLILNEKEAYRHLATTECDWISVYERGCKLGTIMLVWGNGEDVISDYTDNAAMEALIEPILDSI